ncbi:hypothetical protein [Paraburkholderia acidiphila]|uniref:Uncharacterized protein n=1 Tax=Paraburkholderia acidiphila TaxID=2571747 RepID=A0A7Z2GA29_9BURK|nr:hypothetical protein [Paraburkholderia acidiphila]QGZ57988.1 hypothetical protein FAZ97_24260 [Paraburkholderia acidiphila]
MGVAVDLAAALGEPIKITQAIGFANKRRDWRGAQTVGAGAPINIDRAAWHGMRQMRASDHLLFSHLISVN